MREVLFRVNAGLDVGLGHLSRCLNIAREISSYFPVSFFIHTHTQGSVDKYLKEVASDIGFHTLFFFEEDDMDTDIALIVDYVQKYDAYLVLDHYQVNVKYQLRLKKANIHWMQLDSHAAQLFYADIVQHGSPGATDSLYKDLHGTDNGIFLLGPKYVIVNEVFTALHQVAKVRQTLSKVFISFGGGYAKGALKKYLGKIASDYPSLELCVVFRSNHPDKEYFEKLVDIHHNIHLYVDYDSIPELMLSCDLAILASGGMSYEAATLGLPSILIALEDNQHINLAGCSRLGISCSLGVIEQVSVEQLCSTIAEIKDDESRLAEMSKCALEHFDGKGVLRIVDILKQQMIN